MSDQAETDQLRGFIEDDFGGASPEALRPAALLPVSTVAYDAQFPGGHWQVVVRGGINTWVPLGA